jgi:hypothetical protein
MGNVVCSFPRQVDHRTGADHRRSLTLPIVNHPALAAFTHQVSGRSTLFVGHLVAFLRGVPANRETKRLAELICSYGKRPCQIA